MKSVKLTQLESVSNLAGGPKTKFARRNVLRSYVKFSTTPDCQTYLKKNYTSYAIDFSTKDTAKFSRRILKRNSKYLRGLKPYLTGFKQGLEYVKHAKVLKKINILTYPTRVMPATMIEEAIPNQAKKLFTALFRGGTFFKQLKLTFFAFKNLKQRYPQRLKEIESLYLALHIYKCPQVFVTSCPNSTQHYELQTMLPNLRKFQSLNSLTLDLLSYQNISQPYFNELLQNLSYLENLTSLRLLLAIPDKHKKAAKMEKVMEKFSRLKSLYLYLNLADNSNCGNVFSNLLPLFNLKCLTLNINCEKSLDCSDMIIFISSLKSLTKLKIIVSCLSYSAYDAIFQGIKKLESLTSLSIQQTKPDYIDTLEFEFLIDFVQALKQLRKLNLDLGMFDQNPRQMPGFLKCLLGHPSLKESKFSLNSCLSQMKDFRFDEDFYKDIVCLMEKLKAVHIKLRNFPTEVSQKILKMINDKRKGSLQYSCNVLDSLLNQPERIELNSFFSPQTFRIELQTLALQNQM